MTIPRQIAYKYNDCDYCNDYDGYDDCDYSDNSYYGNYTVKPKELYHKPVGFIQKPMGFIQKPNFPFDLNNILSFITPEIILTVLNFAMGLFSKEGKFNIKDFLSKDIMDIGNILGILNIFKDEDNNFDINSIMNIASRFINTGGQSEMSNGNITPNNLADIVKQAIEIANKLKQDSNILETLQNSKEKIDTDTIEDVINAVKNTEVKAETPKENTENINTDNLEDIVKQASSIANDLKKDSNILETLQNYTDKIDLNIIKDVVNAVKNTEAKSETPSENINTNNLADIVKKAMAIANDLKKNNI